MHKHIHLVFNLLNLLFEPSDCGSTVAMRTSAAEVNQSQSSSSSGQCFSNPSYHTVAQCNVVSTISSKLDGTLTLKVWTLPTCVSIKRNFPKTYYSIKGTPNCAFPFTVKHPKEQKWLRVESLLQPQWPRSVFLSLLMTHHIHPEFGLCRTVASRAKTQVSLVQTLHWHQPGHSYPAVNDDEPGVSC